MEKCPHCTDCFKCPFKDCVLTGTKAVTVNRLPYEYERAKKEHTFKSKKRRRKVTVEMEANVKVENGKIIEITEQELYSRYIDGEYYMALDFNEYKWRMENAGTKIVK